MSSALRESISIYVNLLKTTMGTGIMKYPFLFYTYGILPTIILTVISAFASYCGILIYIDINEKYGLGNTLSTVSLHFAPFLKYLADIVVIAKCYMVAVAYLIFLGEQLAFILKYFSLAISPNKILAVLLAGISPFIFISKIDKLKYTSTLGLVAILLLVSSSFYRLLSLGKQSNVEYITNNRSYIKDLCHFVFSFTCHQNIFTIQNEMINYNKMYLKISSFCTFVSAIIIYLIFGLISYLALGKNLNTSYLEAQPDDKLKVAISFFYVVLVVLSIPLQTNPCKAYFLNAINPDLLKKKSYSIFRFGFSLIMILSLYLLAISGVKFDKMCEIVGGSFSTFMCFIFAAIYHFLSFGLFEKKQNTLFSTVALIYGILAFTALLINF